MQDDMELPRGIALAWGIAANPQRGPKREMSVERIVEAAVELADTEGIGAVSMAAVAKQLGYTSMSLYRYVTAKDDLLLLMQEEATGVPSLAYREADGWRAQITTLFQEQVAIYLRHPWILSLPISGSPVTPNSSRWIEAGLETVDQLPLSALDKLAVVLAATGAARWKGMVYAGYDAVSRETGRTPDEVSRDEDRMFDRVIDADDYPLLRSLIDAGAFLSEEDPFAFGLERTLDGVDAYTASRDDPGERPAERPGDLIDDVSDIADNKKHRAAVKARMAAEKELRQAEKALRQARKAEQQAIREARA